MKIAIIGSGISGLTAAYCLYDQHDVSVFEKADSIGGHTATKSVNYNGCDYAIDTGFIVFNDWTYPTFIRLLEKLDIATQPTKMGFSVTAHQGAYEYSGENLNTLFAQRKNLFNWKHLGMLRDILRFNRSAIADLTEGRLPESMTLGEYLKRHRYGQQFINYYLLPMGCAIWSASTEGMLNFPLLFFVRFFKNHGLLSVNDRPQWRVLTGGSSSYLPVITQGFRHQIYTSVDIVSVTRQQDQVTLHFADGTRQHFDQVIFACHSDQALSLLNQPTQSEAAILGDIHYQDNQVVLHRDDTLLPTRQSTWSSWNYLLEETQQSRAILTYNMNILQGIDVPETFCVTLNATERIRQSHILGEYVYSHPVFTLPAIRAQEKWAEINGIHRTWFCGAYWANGFHEDGCASGLRVAEALGGRL